MALNARQKAAIESRMSGAGRAEVAAGGVDGAPTPPKPAKSSAVSAPPAKAAEPAAKAQPSTEAGSTPSASNETPAATPAQVLSFTPKEFKKWAQANPEEALAFREAIDKDTFRMGEEPKTEWIRMTQKGRKMREEMRAQKAEIERVATEKEERARGHLEAAEKTAGQLRYLTEMWGAFQGKGPNGERVIDYDAADEAFRQNSGGLSFDEYARMRARRGVSNPEAARLKADLRRQELELERLRQPTNGAAASAPGAAQGAPEAVKPAAAPAEPPAPATGNGLHPNPEEFWGDEVPSDHPLRQFAGWGKLVDHAMLQFHDDVLDEYSRDAEDIANELLEKKLAALGTKTAAVVVPAHTRNKPKTPKNRGAKLEDPSAPATNVDVPGIPSAAKLTPRGKVNTDRSHRPARPEDLMTDGGLMARQNWAIERAKLRARGIDPDTMEALADD